MRTETSEPRGKDIPKRMSLRISKGLALSEVEGCNGKIPTCVQGVTHEINKLDLVEDADLPTRSESSRNRCLLSHG